MASPAGRLAATGASPTDQWYEGAPLTLADEFWTASDYTPRVQPWTPSPDEQPRDQWRQPPPGSQPIDGGGYPPDASMDYDQPTGSLRRTAQPGQEVDEPRGQSGVYGRPTGQSGVYDSPMAPSGGYESQTGQSGEYESGTGQSGVYGQPVEQRGAPSGVYGRAVPVDSGRHRGWDAERAWQESPRQDSWASPNHHGEWLDAPQHGRRRDTSLLGESRGSRRAPSVPHQQTPLSTAPPVPAEGAPAVPSQQGSRSRGRRAEIRSRSDRSRHEREHSSKRTMRTMVLGGGLCVALVLAGLGYWLFAPSGDEATKVAFIPGATVEGVMGKVRDEGFTCLPPGATFARCTKQVSDVEFSVTVNFSAGEGVSRITANGGTGVQNEVKVTEGELRSFFAMAAQLPFQAASPEAKSWVEGNIRKQASGAVAGVVYETATGQDLLTMRGKP